MATVTLRIEEAYTFPNGDVAVSIISPSGSVIAETTFSALDFDSIMANSQPKNNQPKGKKQ